MGPRLRAGKKVSAPTITITETSRTVNSGPVTGKVPSDSGTMFLGGQVARNRQNRNDHEETAKQHGDAVLTLYQGVLAFKPAKAEPLLPTEEV